MQGDRYGSIFIFLQSDSESDQQNLLKMLLFSTEYFHCIFLAFVDLLLDLQLYSIVLCFCLSTNMMQFLSLLRFSTVRDDDST